MKKKILLVATLLALAWNLYLTASVALNSLSVTPRVAGGQLHTFSAPLRFTYAVQAIVVLFQIFFIVQLFMRNGVWSKSSYLLARIFLILSGLSAAVNLISRNSTERWNAIPALVMALGYLVLGELNFRPRRK